MPRQLEDTWKLAEVSLINLVRSIVALLPPTIHPMVLHFPIALLYLTASIDVLAALAPDRDRFLQRAGFWSLSLTAFFILVTVAAGAVSEQAVHLPPAALRLLHQHKQFAVLTGGAVGLAWIVRIVRRFPAGGGWSLLGTGRGRGTLLSTALVLVAAALITVTASIGGQLVYDHGAGVLGVTRGPGVTGVVRGG